jgi:hypothetical protein
MASQLHLLALGEAGDSVAAERKAHRPISARNQAVGRRGLAQARAALQAARQTPAATTLLPRPQPRPASASTRRRPAA